MRQVVRTRKDLLLGHLGLKRRGVAKKRKNNNHYLQLCKMAQAEAQASKLHSEVSEQLDLSLMRYSRVWEDYRLLAKGLNICSHDSLLVITRYIMSRAMRGLIVRCNACLPAILQLGRQCSEPAVGRTREFKSVPRGVQGGGGGYSSCHWHGVYQSIFFATTHPTKDLQGLLAIVL